MSNNVTARISKIVRVVPRNRNTELVLLLFVLAINAFEIIQVQLSTLQSVTGDFWFYWGCSGWSRIIDAPNVAASGP